MVSVYEVIYDSCRVVVLFWSSLAGHLTVCGDAVLCCFWCSFAVIFVLIRGIAVSKRKAVCVYYNFYVLVFGEKIVCAVLTFFRTVCI